jgi:hypothetical protein
MKDKPTTVKAKKVDRLCRQMAKSNAARRSRLQKIIRDVLHPEPKL